PADSKALGQHWGFLVAVNQDHGEDPGTVCQREVSGGGTCEEAQLAQSQEAKILPKGPKAQVAAMCAS
ncbi:hypothetical protein MDA_GLEAN10002475, partial [Myotis davidii]